jgi:hypothetical protein
VLVVPFIAACFLGAGCGADDGSGPTHEQRASRASSTGALRTGDVKRLRVFARHYLVHHVCPDAPTARALARGIVGALRRDPQLTRAAAAESVCNETRH